MPSTIPPVWRRLALAGACTLALPVATRSDRRAPLPTLPVVVANDNRAGAGSMHGDTLVARLQVRMARWYPDTAGGPHLDVAAFAEEGRPPQIPAPLLRVRVGTVLDVTVTNSLPDSTIWVHGLGPRAAQAEDSVGIAPGASRRLVFPAGPPGTYTYWAWPGSVNHDTHERETAGGALVIDTLGARGDDRVFVMNIWGEQVDSTTYRNALAINGRSWPHSERVTATVGDTVRWRWVNASYRNHPMHLHGFYYRVEARGTGREDTLYAPAQRRNVVTEVMPAGATMAMSWVPERDGNWLFHCHIGFHVVPEARLDPPPGGHLALSHDAGDHMAGLVLGVNVRPSPGWTEPPRGTARRLRLVVQEGRRQGRAPRALGFVLQRNGRDPAPDSVEIPGTPLVLHVGEPTDITVVNRLREATAVHWHGLELESWSDGVAGWSGVASHVAPAIAPADSFTARLTLRRPGTFMYHTHLNDLEQLTSGLYGAIIVLPAGVRHDPATDHVFVGSWDGGEDPPHLLINGDSIPKLLHLAAGAVHRFRFVNIGVATGLAPVLVRDSATVAWRHVALDGADLPPYQVRLLKAPFRIDVGQTADFEWRPTGPGDYAIAITSAGRRAFRRIPLVVR